MRTRNGRRLWLNRLELWASPFTILPEMMFGALGVALLVITALEPGAPLAARCAGVLLGFTLALSLAFKHGVRCAHALHCRRRGTFIVDDLIGGFIGSLCWLIVFLGLCWLVLWDFLYSAVWG